MIRYEVTWCQTSADDIRQKLFRRFNDAKTFAIQITATDIFIGACGITQQESTEHCDDVGVFYDWDDIATWECDGENVYEV